MTSRLRVSSTPVRSLTRQFAAWLACVLALSAVAGAQVPIPGAGAVNDEVDPAEEHIWFVIDVRDDTSVLLHMPPGASTFGQANLAAHLVKRPSALAAAGRSAYLCFAPIREKNGTQRRQVLMISAAPVPGTPDWQYTGTPRLHPLASVPGPGELRGFEATGAGLHALMLRPNGPELLILKDGTWETDDLPAELGATSAPFPKLRLLSESATLAILDLSDTSTPRLWTRASGRAARAETPAWTRASPELERSLEGMAMPILSAITRDQLVWAEPGDDGHVTLVAASEIGRFNLGSRDLKDAEGALIATGASPSVLLLTRTGDEGAGFGQVDVERISITSGRTLNEAEITTNGPISKSQFIFVLLLLGAVVMLILAFVFWPEEIEEPALPPAYVLAPASTRILAGAIDFVIGAVPAALLLGVPIMDVVFPTLEHDPVDALAATLLGVGLAALHATIGEWLFGRSVGKALVGLRVLSVREDGFSRPQLWQAALRNVVKWGAPPVALAGLTYARRHLGDLAGATVVVGAAAAPDAQDD